MSAADPRPFTDAEVEYLIGYTMRVTGLRPGDIAQRRREVRELAQARALRLAVERWAHAHSRMLALRLPAGIDRDPMLAVRAAHEHDQACAALLDQAASLLGVEGPTEDDECACHYIHGGVRVPEVSCAIHRPAMPPPVLPASAITTEMPAVLPAPRPRRRLPLRAAIVAGLLLIALVLTLHPAGVGG